MLNKEPEAPKETPPFEDELRSEFLLGSQEIPDRAVFRDRFTFITTARVISLVVVIVLCLSGWFFFAGPGKGLTEKLINKLAERAQPATPTQVAVAVKPPVQTKTATLLAKQSFPSSTPTRVRASQTPSLTPVEGTTTVEFSTLSKTPSPSPSSTPSATPTGTPTATGTPAASVAGCVPAASITAADVGKTLCVTGNVLRTEFNPGSFLIILENPKDAFYFLSYDRKWETLEAGTCVFATGKILQLGNNPVMILDYKIPLEYCP